MGVKKGAKIQQYTVPLSEPPIVIAWLAVPDSVVQALENTEERWECELTADGILFRPVVMPELSEIAFKQGVIDGQNAREAAIEIGAARKPIRPSIDQSLAFAPHTEEYLRGFAKGAEADASQEREA